MDIVTPGLGLIFWTTLTFFLLLFLLAKFAWKPILKAVQDREESINAALKAAESAKSEVAALQNSSEQLLKEAREARERRERRERRLSVRHGGAPVFYRLLSEHRYISKSCVSCV